MAGSYLLVAAVHRPAMYHDHLHQELLMSPAPRRDQAAAALASLGDEARLIQTLRSTNQEIRECARRALDTLWFSQEGVQAARALLEADQAMKADRHDEAAALLDALLEKHPGYADAWSRRASLMWKMDRMGASKRDCEKALKLNPLHYGAWLGLGMANLEMQNHEDAVRCLRMYLMIQPYDVQARRWLDQCTAIARIEARTRSR